MEKLDEGLLFDLLTKRRAGHFTGDEILWAVDHMVAVRWTQANMDVVEGLRTGRLTVAKSDSLVVTYDQLVGLQALIERGVGKRNLGNINSDITQERFKLVGTGVRTVKARVEPFLDDETSEQAAQRLTAKGCILGNTGDLAGFLHDHPKEVEKWTWVLAIREDSRWTSSDGVVYVPCAYVLGANRHFSLDSFRVQLDSDDGVLVLCE